MLNRTAKHQSPKWQTSRRPVSKAVRQRNQLLANDRLSQVTKRRILIICGLFLMSCNQQETSDQVDASPAVVSDASEMRADRPERQDQGYMDATEASDAGPQDSAAKDAQALVPDQGFVDASIAPFIEVGSGDQSFIPVSDTDELPFILGPQGGGSEGGYHLWMALRSQGFNPTDADLSVYLVRPGDNTVLVSMSRPVTLQAIGNYYGLTGIRIVPPDCCSLVGQALMFRVEITDASGATGMNEALFIGGDRCPDIDDNNICP